MSTARFSLKCLIAIPMLGAAMGLSAPAIARPPAPNAASSRKLPNDAEWQAVIAKLSADRNPRLARNKRLVLEAQYAMAVALRYGGIDQVAAKFMSPNYVQHDPNVPPGRDGFVRWFKVGAMQPATPKGEAPNVTPPMPAKVFAEGDMVSLLLEIKMPDPFNPPAIYSYFPVVAYRVENGRLAEHWGGSPKGAPYCRFGMCDPKK